MPAALTAALAERLADPRLAGTVVGASAWVEGFGEVLATNADVPLLPASNQKLYTAIGALAVLGPEATLRTEVRATGDVIDGTLAGDLVLAGSGDPTLTSRGAHGLDELAAAVRARGVERLTGGLVVDGSRFDARLGAVGWFDWHVPGYVPPITALVVDGNRSRRDPAYLADPSLGNLALFREALRRAGVVVDGPDSTDGPGAGGEVVATTASPSVGELVTRMLLESDNLTAEVLLRATGAAVDGTGTWAAGTAAGDDALARLCVVPQGNNYDSSGLSRLDRRSAREWRRMLQVAARQPWGPLLEAALPVAGRTGTLQRRFLSTPAAGNVRAKTGWILEGRALSGYLTTAGGRRGIFSVVVNGTTPDAPVAAAIDDLVVTLASHEG
ncbi:hypothetical protein BH18ACT1_BH18ACT1_10450 [soil metagenome]